MIELIGSIDPKHRSPILLSRQTVKLNKQPAKSLVGLEWHPSDKTLWLIHRIPFFSGLQSSRSQERLFGRHRDASQSIQTDIEQVVDAVLVQMGLVVVNGLRALPVLVMI